MKKSIFALIITSAILAVPFVSRAGGRIVQLNLREEKIFGVFKACTYELEVNLGPLASATPYQIHRKNEHGNYEPMTYHHSFSINANSEMILKIYSYSNVEYQKSCGPSAELILLN